MEGGGWETDIPPTPPWPASPPADMRGFREENGLQDVTDTQPSLEASTVSRSRPASVKIEVLEDCGDDGVTHTREGTTWLGEEVSTFGQQRSRGALRTTSSGVGRTPSILSPRSERSRSVDFDELAENSRRSHSPRYSRQLSEYAMSERRKTSALTSEVAKALSKQLAEQAVKDKLIVQERAQQRSAARSEALKAEQDKAQVVMCTAQWAFFISLCKFPSKLHRALRVKRSQDKAAHFIIPYIRRVAVARRRTKYVRAQLALAQGMQRPTVDTMQAHPIFSDWPRDALAQLIHSLSVHAFQEGEVVVYEGSPACAAYLVSEGQLSVQHTPAATGSGLVRRTLDGSGNLRSMQAARGSTATEIKAAGHWASLESTVLGVALATVRTADPARLWVLEKGDLDRVMAARGLQEVTVAAARHEVELSAVRWSPATAEWLRSQFQPFRDWNERTLGGVVAKARPRLFLAGETLLEGSRKAPAAMLLSRGAVSFSLRRLRFEPLRDGEPAAAVAAVASPRRRATAAAATSPRPTPVSPESPAGRHRPSSPIVKPLVASPRAALVSPSSTSADAKSPASQPASPGVRRKDGRRRSSTVSADALALSHTESDLRRMLLSADAPPTHSTAVRRALSLKALPPMHCVRGLFRQAADTGEPFLGAPALLGFRACVLRVSENLGTYRALRPCLAWEIDTQELYNGLLSHPEALVAASTEARQACADGMPLLATDFATAALRGLLDGRRSSVKALGSPSSWRGLKGLLASCKPRMYDLSTEVATAGQPCEGALLITKGKAEITTSAGPVVLGPGAAVGLGMEAVLEMPWRATCKVLREVEGWLMPHSHLVEFLKSQSSSLRGRVLSKLRRSLEEVAEDDGEAAVSPWLDKATALLEPEAVEAGGGLEARESTWLDSLRDLSPFQASKLLMRRRSSSTASPQVLAAVKRMSSPLSPKAAAAILSQGGSSPRKSVLSVLSSPRKSVSLPSALSPRASLPSPAAAAADGGPAAASPRRSLHSSVQAVQASPAAQSTTAPPSAIKSAMASGEGSPLRKQVSVVEPLDEDALEEEDPQDGEEDDEEDRTAAESRTFRASESANWSSADDLESRRPTAPQLAPVDAGVELTPLQVGLEPRKEVRIQDPTRREVVAIARQAFRGSVFTPSSDDTQDASSAVWRMPGRRRTTTTTTRQSVRSPSQPSRASRPSMPGTGPLSPQSPGRRSMPAQSPLSPGRRSMPAQSPLSPGRRSPSMPVQGTRSPHSPGRRSPSMPAQSPHSPRSPSMAAQGPTSPSAGRSPSMPGQEPTSPSQGPRKSVAEGFRGAAAAGGEARRRPLTEAAARGPRVALQSRALMRQIAEVTSEAEGAEVADREATLAQDRRSAALSRPYEDATPASLADAEELGLVTPTRMSLAAEISNQHKARKSAVDRYQLTSQDGVEDVTRVQMRRGTVAAGIPLAAMGTPQSEEATWRERPPAAMSVGTPRTSEASPSLASPRYSVPAMSPTASLPLALKERKQRSLPPSPVQGNLSLPVSPSRTPAGGRSTSFPTPTRTPPPLRSPQKYGGAVQGRCSMGTGGQAHLQLGIAAAIREARELLDRQEGALREVLPPEAAAVDHSAPPEPDSAAAPAAPALHSAAAEADPSLKPLYPASVARLLEGSAPSARVVMRLRSPARLHAAGPRPPPPRRNDAPLWRAVARPVVAESCQLRRRELAAQAETPCYWWRPVPPPQPRPPPLPYHAASRSRARAEQRAAAATVAALQRSTRALSRQKRSR